MNASDLFTIKPKDIVDAYDDGLRSELSKGDLLSMLWDKFGDKTVEVMAEGSKLLALLWESAWKEGNGDKPLLMLQRAIKLI